MSSGRISPKHSLRKRSSFSDSRSLLRPQLLRSFFEEEGHRVHFAESGEEALGRMDAAHYDVVISDVRRPGLSGFELYEEIRARHPGMEKRMIFITGDTLSEDIQRFFSQTGIPCLAKPFNLADLRKEIARVTSL